MKELHNELEEHIGYALSKRIGKGSFGTVYQVSRGSQKFALKVEETAKVSTPQLENEHRVYVKMQRCVGVPKVFYFGTFGGYSYLVTELLDYSLADILERRGKFSIKTVAMLAKRLIKTIEAFHSNNLLYRDMKPENVMVRNSDIYLIDYGMCKRFIVNGKHIPLRTDKVLTGTARYTSVNTHKGLEQGRRDDLECISYLLIFLLNGGELPWMRIPAPTRKEKYAKIGKVKETIPLSRLCAELSGGKQIEKFIVYSRELGFEEKPDYKYCISLFDQILHNHGFSDDNIFDWTPLPPTPSTPPKKATCGFVAKLKKILSMCNSESKQQKSQPTPNEAPQEIIKSPNNLKNGLKRSPYG